MCKEVEATELSSSTHRGHAYTMCSLMISVVSPDFPAYAARNGQHLAWRKLSWSITDGCLGFLAKLGMINRERK